jgi:hypothetical protein
LRPHATVQSVAAVQVPQNNVKTGVPREQHVHSFLSLYLTSRGGAGLRGCDIRLPLPHQSRVSAAGSAPRNQ